MSTIKRDQAVYQTNSYPDDINPVFGALVNKETAYRFMDIRREIQDLD
jgi:hypothetical protein